MTHRSYYEYFKKKLKEAQPFEDVAIDKICKRNKVKLLERQDETNYKHMKYDFKTSDDKTYEVKNDTRAIKTGNIFVEFQQFGKSSGIEITEALYHIFVIESTYYLIKTVDLMDLCEGCNIGFVKMSDSKGYLVKLHTFQYVAMEI
jgi:uncharacterized protein YuzE